MSWPNILGWAAILLLMFIIGKFQSLPGRPSRNPNAGSMGGPLAFLLFIILVMILR